MLARCYRFSRRVNDDFFAQARVWSWRWGRVFFIYEPNHFQQIALIAAKKNLPRSVERHRVRRRASVAIQTLVKNDEWPPGRYVITLNQQALTVKLEAMITDVRQWLTRTKRARAT